MVVEWTACVTGESPGGKVVLCNQMQLPGPLRWYKRAWVGRVEADSKRRVRVRVREFDSVCSRCPIRANPSPLHSHDRQSSAIHSLRPCRWQQQLAYASDRRTSRAKAAQRHPPTTLSLAARQVLGVRTVDPRWDSMDVPQALVGDG